MPSGSPLLPAGDRILVALAAPIARFRHGDLVERRQVKWFALVLACVIVVFALAPDELSFAGIALLPVGIGIAILRYRLYEIDRIVSRTVAYAAITAILAAVFAGAVLVLQALLARPSRPTAWLSSPRHSSSRRCSSHCGGASRQRWIAGSTAPATTRP